MLAKVGRGGMRRRISSPSRPGGMRSRRTTSTGRGEVRPDPLAIFDVLDVDIALGEIFFSKLANRTSSSMSRAVMRGAGMGKLLQAGGCGGRLFTVRSANWRMWSVTTRRCCGVRVSCTSTRACVT